VVAPRAHSERKVLDLPKTFGRRERPPEAGRRPSVNGTRMIDGTQNDRSGMAASQARATLICIRSEQWRSRKLMHLPARRGQVVGGPFAGVTCAMNGAGGAANGGIRPAPEFIEELP